MSNLPMRERVLSAMRETIDGNRAGFNELAEPTEAMIETGRKAGADATLPDGVAICYHYGPCPECGATD